MRLANANGPDIFVYPGFFLLRGNGHDLSFVDVRDITIDYGGNSFSEEGSVPKDSELLSKTWKKVNKDGSRDKRFAGNHEIPVMQYGSLVLKSTTGMKEAYMFSASKKAEAFAHAFTEYRRVASEHG